MISWQRPTTMIDMSIRAVLFDFSGTLFRLEPDRSRLAGLSGGDGMRLDDETLTEIMRRMTAPVGQVVEFDTEHAHEWANRDLDPDLHRKVYLEVLRQSGVPQPETAVPFYEQFIDPDSWTPYPDTGAALAASAGHGVKVGVLSNIAFDIRPAFAARGWDAHVDEFVLSFEVGAVKPQPEIFRSAVRALGVPATDTLMVGDSEEADGGACALGCSFALVDPLPTAERPDALVTALRKYGIG
jgi:FMN phosphatase YigB (HAD superfamily)